MGKNHLIPNISVGQEQRPGSQFKAKIEYVKPSKSLGTKPMLVRVLGWFLGLHTNNPSQLALPLSWLVFFFFKPTSKKQMWKQQNPVLIAEHQLQAWLDPGALNYTMGKHHLSMLALLSSLG